MIKTFLYYSTISSCAFEKIVDHKGPKVYTHKMLQNPAREKQTKKNKKVNIKFIQELIYV